MFSWRYSSCFSFFIYLTFVKSQLNLYYTDKFDSIESHDYPLQMNCLYIFQPTRAKFGEYKTVIFCLSESLPTIHSDFSPSYTFADLQKQNITSEQLYRWSAPIDLIERYQIYLNEFSIRQGEDLYYNCTYPRFGPMCQYELELSSRYDLNKSKSFQHIIWDFYNKFPYKSTNEVTCYIDFQCQQSLTSSCLDWTDICDGKVDCLDTGADEEHCWQLEMNECEENEHQCSNGQCIPKEFFRDGMIIRDCLDGNDEISILSYLYTKIEDTICENLLFTRSCSQQRQEFLINKIYSLKNNTISHDCWLASKCLLQILEVDLSKCNFLCRNNQCVMMIENTCPEMFYIPNVPIISDHIYLAYTKYDIIKGFFHPFICSKYFDEKNFLGHITIIRFNDQICFRPVKIPKLSSSLGEKLRTNFHRSFYQIYSSLKRHTRFLNQSSISCQQLNVYQCNGTSQCIPAFRFKDHHYDCPNWDDEEIHLINITLLSRQIREQLFKCEISNKYISRKSFDDEIDDCPVRLPKLFSEDEPRNTRYEKRFFSFYSICDGHVDLYPILINGQNMTDETDCEQWQCHNLYTTCDQIWNCPYGQDEINCKSSLTYKCPSIDTKQMINLPIKRINDGHIDCFGAYDEPKMCPSDIYQGFYCNRTNEQSCLKSLRICSTNEKCVHPNDFVYCRNSSNKSLVNILTLINFNKTLDLIQYFNSQLQLDSQIDEMKYFSLDRTINKVSTTTTTTGKLEQNRLIFLSDEHYCHRGLVVHVTLNPKTNFTKRTCFCLPSYYGSRCQYQTHRISLGLRFRALSDSWQTLFAIVISLIDNTNERTIHSVEQFSYLSIRDCKVKFNNDLFYATRSMNLTRKYFLHIDIYEKISLDYRGSLLFPLKFAFLPVYRFSLLIQIPQKSSICSKKKCQHGKCRKYSNIEETFCQCDSGWSGEFCHIEQH
ncbi:unnamed protein product, partial [Adineta ricciae]